MTLDPDSPHRLTDLDLESLTALAEETFADPPFHPYGELRVEPARTIPTEFEGASPDVWVAASTSQSCVEIMTNAAQFGGVVDRRLAQHMLTRLIRAAIVPYTGRMVAQPSAFALAGRPEEWLRRTRRSVQVRTVWSWLRSSWPLVGLAMSVVAVVMVLAGRFVPAAAIILTRIIVSSSLPTPGLASDLDHRRATTAGPWGLNWSRCVIGHFVDALMAAAIAAYLLLDGQDVWGLICLAVPLLVLSSTLLRVAAAQVGVVLDRLYTERIARNGVLLMGLVLAGVAPSIGPGAFPTVAIATTGAATYALAEIIRTVTYVHRREVIERKLSDDEALGARLANVVPLVESCATGPVDQMLRPNPGAFGSRLAV